MPEVEGLCITGPFLLVRLRRSAGSIEHMFANRPDRSVGSFPAACGKFVRNPQGVERLGTIRGKDAACELRKALLASLRAALHGRRRLLDNHLRRCSSAVVAFAR